MAHIYAAFVKQILHVPEREGEPHIERYRQANDLGASLEPLEGIAFCHSGTLSTALPRSRKVPLTKPLF